MQIREATDQDIPEILDVLKASLGETSSKKTEAVWRYKHVDNPFGKSLVLVAEDMGMIIGVRAFMRWQWKKGEKVYSAFRAVDTATHPDHQGKGIFKKLTFHALEIAKNSGDHFVFNTPNNQSKPGYLKMGWKEVGKVTTTLVPVNPIYWKNSKSQKPLSSQGIDIPSELLLLWNSKLEADNVIFTPKSLDYIEWRYIKNPLQRYFMEINENVILAGYLKQHSNLKELRVSEIIISPDANKKLVKDKIHNWAKESGANFISYSSSYSKGLFKRSVSANVGPMLTFKPININHDEFLKLSAWAYSLGDFELF